MALTSCLLRARIDKKTWQRDKKCDNENLTICLNKLC